jgi:tetratricopeptide (TPR) repeat protein
MRNRGNVSKRISTLLLFAFFSISNLSAQVRTVEATGEYRMGDNDTRNDARKLALLDAKRLALEQAGTYLQSVTEVKNLMLSRDDINTYTAGILEVVDQKEQTAIEGNTTIVRIEVTVHIDTAKVAQQIAALRENSATKNELTELKAEMDRLRELVTKQNQELAKIKSQTEVAALAKERQQLISNAEVNTLLTQSWVALSGSQGGVLITGTSTPEGRIKARTLLEQALAADPLSPKVHERMGVLLNEEGNRTAAIQEFRKALDLKPENPGAHNSLGNSLRSNGDLTGAVAEYREAIRQDPNYALAHLNLGKALQNQKDINSAIVEYREAIRLKPNEASFHNDLALFLQEQRDLNGAAAQFRETIRLAPSVPVYHYQFGRILRSQKDLIGAAAEFRETIRLQPNHVEAHNELGNTLLDQKDLDGAAMAFREAIRLQPNYVPARFNLGLVLSDQGRREEAVQAFQEFLKIAGNSPSDKPFIDRAQSYLQGGSAR